MTMDTQRANAKVAAAFIAELAREHRVVVTHGNGPQVGLLALQNDNGADGGFPLDVLGAETEGMIGYLLEQEIGQYLDDGEIVTLLTQVVVDEADPAFASPTKFIGPVYDGRDAMFLAHDRGWTVAPDGDRWRRVVASPEPQRIVEIESVRLLANEGRCVICTGGGGIPVVPRHDGGFRGVEAVVDKDLAAALLATELNADALLLLTDVDAVYRNWGEPSQERIGVTSVEELRSLSLPAGSMGPKVEAICRFAERSGGFAAIGSLDSARATLSGAAGTCIEARADASGRKSFVSGREGPTTVPVAQAQ
jgi:carbamate kinase